MCCLSPRPLPEGEMGLIMAAPTHLMPSTPGRKWIFRHYVPQPPPALTENKEEESNQEIQGTLSLSQPEIKEEVESKLGIQGTLPLSQKYIDL